MLQFLLAVHFVLTLSIIGLIMLQKHDSDGALGSSGGKAASGMFSVRGQANILTKSTAVLMTIFIINCLVMAKLVKHTPEKGSVIDMVARESAPERSSVPPAGNIGKKTLPAGTNTNTASTNANQMGKNTDSAGKNTSGGTTSQTQAPTPIKPDNGQKKK
jgi:preprotein translocase subunit SecG